MPKNIDALKIVKSAMLPKIVYGPMRTGKVSSHKEGSYSIVSSCLLGFMFLAAVIATISVNR
jgi:hypothetical protein